MDPEDLRAFAKRWQQVAARERQELRSTSPLRKFEQLAALMESAIRFDWKTTDAAEIEAVRERWKRLQVLFSE